jgi:hypothetical protein
MEERDPLDYRNYVGRLTMFNRGMGRVERSKYAAAVALK